MQKVHLYFTLLGFLLFFSCENDPAGKSFVVKGTFKNSPGGDVSLQRFDGDASAVIGQMPLAADGTFSITAKDAIPAIYRIQHGPQTVLLSYDGSEKEINIEGEAKKLSAGEYTITGSAGSRLMQDYVQSMAKIQLNEFRLGDYNERDQYPLIYNFLLFKFVPFHEENIDMHFSSIETVLKKYPGHKQALAHRAFITAPDNNRPVSGREAASPLKLGEVVPDIALPNKTGQIMRLSELKGNVVVIDFWASWCGPCRKYGNPELVRMNEKYKNEKFQIMNVALERNGQNDKWLKAMETDKLTWPYNVVDHKREFSPLFGASKIPMSFVVDQYGRLAAINPHGADLEGAIDKLLRM